MRWLCFSVSAFLILAAGLAVSAQVDPPPGAGDKPLENRDIKTRSIELERVKRDAKKVDTGGQTPSPVSATKFQEIKEDFEKIQLVQNEIVAAYSMSKEIDYEKISQFAEQMNKSAARLETNLFPPIENQKNEKKAKEQQRETEKPLPQDLKSLIVEQDNALASFVSNAMFTNPQVVNAADNAKAQSDLKRLISLTVALKSEAEKHKK